MPFDNTEYKKMTLDEKRKYIGKLCEEWRGNPKNKLRLHTELLSELIDVIEEHETRLGQLGSAFRKLRDSR